MYVEAVNRNQSPIDGNTLDVWSSYSLFHQGFLVFRPIVLANELDTEDKDSPQDLLFIHQNDSQFFKPPMLDRSSILDLDKEEFTSFVSLYKDLHAHPGLSLQEEFAADRVEACLKEYGYAVTSGIAGYGLIGVLENGPGKTILLRADMDALPVEEISGVPYASKKRQVDTDGIEKPVMHACGHDMHVGMCSFRALASCIKGLCSR